MPPAPSITWLKSATIGLQRQMNSSVKKQMKHKCCSICSIVCGVILIVIAGVVPYIMNNLIVSGAKKAATLTQEKEPYWNGIPSMYEIGINERHYMNNCTNIQDVSKYIKFNGFICIGNFQIRCSLIYGVWFLQLSRVWPFQWPRVLKQDGQYNWSWSGYSASHF